MVFDLLWSSLTPSNETGSMFTKTTIYLILFGKLFSGFLLSPSLTVPVAAEWAVGPLGVRQGYGAWRGTRRRARARM